ncbi:MAG: hypothetical protein NZ533_03915 [Casimicrobiaceae bacterium]|nr:hypothetical protein [Casimicrobiaceae bacterium]
MSTLVLSDRNRPPLSLRDFALGAAGIFGALLLLAAIYHPVLNAPLFFDDELISRESFRNDYAQLFTLKVRTIAYHSIVALERLFGEGHVLWQRSINVALHALVALTLFGFYRTLSRVLANEPPSPQTTQAGVWTSLPLPEGRWGVVVLGFACAWFLLHPVAVYGVAYLVQRSIVLATLFSLLALWCTLLWADRGHPYALLGALLAYVAAMFSKEYAVALPAAMLGIVVIVRRPSPRRVLVWLLPFALLALAGGYLLFQRYGHLIGQPFDEASVRYVRQLSLIAPGIEGMIWPLSIANEMRLFFHYGFLWLVPNVGAMSIDLRPRFPVSFDDLALVLGVLGYLALLAGACVGLFSSSIRVRLAAWCLLLVTTLYVTEFATVWIQDPFVLYRSYLWAIALPGLALALAPAEAPERPALRRALAVGAAVALVLASLLAHERAYSMRSPLAVWEDAVAKLPEELTPGQSRAYFNRGAALREAGQARLALRDFEHSTRLGDGGEGLFATAEWLAENGRIAQALQALAGAVRRGIEDSLVFVNAGVLLETHGEPVLALDAYSRAIASPRAEPGVKAEAHARRALLRFALGQADADTLGDVRTAQAFDPRAFHTRLASAYALLAEQKPGEAAAAFSALLNERASLRLYAGALQAFAAAGQRERAQTLLTEARTKLAAAEYAQLEPLAARLGLTATPARS